MLTGTQAPKFIANINAAEVEVLLDYSVILKDEPVQDVKTNISPRTGLRTFHNTSKHWIFEVQVNLWKYENPAETYQNIKQYEGTSVYLYQHSDGFIFAQSNNLPVEFIIAEVVENTVDDRFKFDYIKIRFLSKDYLDRSNLISYIISPQDIDDLYLWFSDDSLEQLTDNNFKWSDKVSSGTKYLSGNYGTGDGLITVNGKTVLHSTGDVGETNQLAGGSILNFPAFTFIGFIQKDLPQGIESYLCHLWEQQNITPHYTISLSAAISGGSGSDGLKLRAQDGFASNIVLGLDGVSGGADSGTPPHKKTLIMIKVTYDNSIVLYINGVEYTGAFISSNQYPIVKYIVNKYWEGIIGEFMFYSRILTTDELNSLGNYFRKKYALDWSNI